MLPFDTRVSELRGVRARPGTLGCGRCGRAAHGSRGSRATARRSRRSTSRPCRAALPVSKRGGDGRRVTLASCRRGSTPLALQLRTISGSSGTGSSAAAPSAGTGSGSVGSAASSVALTDSTTARRSKPLSTAHLRMAPRGRWGELRTGQPWRILQTDILVLQGPNRQRLCSGRRVTRAPRTAARAAARAPARAGAGAPRARALAGLARWAPPLPRALAAVSPRRVAPPPRLRRYG